MLPTGLSSTAMKRSPCALLTIECHHWFPNEAFFFIIQRYGPGRRARIIPMGVPISWAQAFKRRNLGSRAKNARWTRTLTSIVSLSGRGDRKEGQVES